MGSPPSLAQAQLNRDTEAIEARLLDMLTNQKSVHTVAAAALFLTVLYRTASDGTYACMATSIGPIEMRNTDIWMMAMIPFMKMDQKMARGTADLAFLVSSLMWMALSKP